MGMSASQARLLSLTARQHDVELRAQKLQADKLRLANDSDRVYLTYLNALNARKVQYSRIEADGSTAFRDATLAILENGAIPGYKGEASDTAYLLQNVADGSIYVTQEFADAFGIQANGKGTTVPGLDEYLEKQGCTQYEIMDTVTDYSNVISAYSVANNIITKPGTIQVPAADTYSLSGTLAAPFESHRIPTYSCTAGGTTPTVSSESGNPIYNPSASGAIIDGNLIPSKILPSGDDTITVGTVNPETKTVVTGGTALEVVKSEESEPVKNIDKTTLTIKPNQTFNAFEGVTYQFKTEDLNKSLSELFPNMDFTDTTVKDRSGYDTDANRLSIYYDNDSLYNTNLIANNKNTARIQYTADTTLGELLNNIAGLSDNINFNSTTGTLSSSEILGFHSTDDAYVDDILADYLAGVDENGTIRTFNYSTTNQTFSLDTKMKDVAYSNWCCKGSSYSSNVDTYSTILHIKDNNTNEYIGAGYDDWKNADNITYREYFEYLKNTKLKDYGFDYKENPDGSIEITMNGDYLISSGFRGTPTQSGTSTTTTDYQINRNAIAENIYLARSIINETTPEEYSANHDTQITNILTEMQNAYNSYASDEDKRQLLLFSDALSQALKTNDKEQISAALQKLGQTIESESYKPSDPVTDPNNSNMQLINNVTFSFDDADVSITPNSTQVNTDRMIIDGASSDNDIIKALAYGMTVKANGSFDDYENTNLVYIQSLVDNGELNSRKLLSLASYYGTDGNNDDWNAIIEALNNKNLTALNQYTDKYLSETEYPDANIINRKADEFDVVSIKQDKDKISGASANNDILMALAYGMTPADASYDDYEAMYQYVSGLGLTTNQLVSLASYYGTDDWQAIINALKNNDLTALNQYTNNYPSSQYDIVDQVAGTYNVDKVSNGSTPGSLTVSTNQEMEQYLAYSLWQADDSKKYSEYLALIQNKYDAYQLAQLVEEFDTFKNDLKQGNDLTSQLTKYNSDDYELEQENKGYSVTETSTPGEDNVSVANPDDILDRLAYDVYVAQGSTGNPNDIKSQLKKLFSNRELAGISYYLNNSTAWNEIINQLKDGNIPTQYTTRYQNYDNIYYDTNNKLTINTIKNFEDKEVKGTMQIPLLDQIASNLVAAFRTQGLTVEEGDIIAILKEKYGEDNNDNNAILANINEIVHQFLKNGNFSNDVNNIYNHLFNNSTLNITNTYSADNYDISRANLGRCNTVYGTKEVGTGKFEWRKDDKYNEALKKWHALKQLEEYKFVIVSAEWANSKDFLNNHIIDNEAILLKFDSKSTEVTEMPKTNIAVELPLQEAADTENVKKAEATYEADIKKINRKETKIDTELSQLEAERTAIKTEQDCVKTVAKDNVNLTFKLFS